MEKVSRDGRNDLQSLTFTKDVATADTLKLQVTDKFGNSVGGIHAFIVAGDTVDEDLFASGTFAAAATGLNSLVAAEDATQPDTLIVFTDVNGAYVSSGTMVTGVTVRATFLTTGETKEATLT